MDSSCSLSLPGGPGRDPDALPNPTAVDRGVPTARELAVEPRPGAANPVLTAGDVDDVEFVADPFVVRSRTTYNLFFEIKSRRTSLFGLRDHPQFDIGHATTEDGLDWTYRGVVLPSSQAEHI